jgi:hypothetical protein
MPWPLTVISCLSAGIVIGFFACSCVSDALIADAELRAFNAQDEANHQKELADKWRRVSDPRITEQVTDLQARRQRRQTGGFGY